MPKGLRSFDAQDADYFLELLPGPRDREGLPDSIRFWKTRIEETDPDHTFSVGLIYGPSGCGKSSLVKAGLLPRLAKAVTAVYVEATADETEARLLKGLRRQIPDLPSNLGVIESLTTLRQGRFLPSGQKVLLLLDQFEQWLHAKRNEENTELVQALRQCDGGRVAGTTMPGTAARRTATGTRRTTGIAISAFGLPELRRWSGRFARRNRPLFPFRCRRRATDKSLPAGRPVLVASAKAPDGPFCARIEDRQGLAVLQGRKERLRCRGFCPPAGQADETVKTLLDRTR